MLEIWGKGTSQAFKNVLGPVFATHGTQNKLIKDIPEAASLEEGEEPSRIVLATGTACLDVFKQAGVVPKNRTISSLRGTPFQYGDASVLLTFGPDLIDNDYSKKSDIQWDAALACRLHDTGSLEPTVGTYRYVSDFSDAVEYVKRRYSETGEAVPLSVDLETLGLNPFNPEAWIISISITYHEGQADVIRFEGLGSQPVNTVYKDGIVTELQVRHPDLLYQISWLLNSEQVRVRGANFKFDCVWMRHKWGIGSDSHSFDTTMVGSLLDENRSNSLNMHAKMHTGMGGYDDSFNKNHDKSRMDLVPPEDLLGYAGGDTDACYRVAAYQKNQLTQDKKLTRFYVKLLHPASKAFEDMEMEGVLVDRPYFQKLEMDLNAHLDALTEKALSNMPKRLLNKHAGDLSLTRAALINDFMFTPNGLNLKPRMFTNKTKKPSTTLEHLLMFEDQPEAKAFIDCLKEYAVAKKTLGTYVTGFLKHLRADGKFHPTAILYKGAFGDSGGNSGTLTGRTAFRDPAIQTVPKHTAWAKKLRKGYIAPEGFTLVGWDYSQGELRVTACVANESAMIEAYRNGIDLHLKTGAKLNGFSLEDALAMKAAGDKQIKAIRQGGKAGNFGLIYGMGAEGYRLYAMSSYGVELTTGMAGAQRDAFFDTYPGLTAWHEEYRAKARRFAAIRSPLGRIRHLPNIRSKFPDVRSKAERQAINSPIQATLSDLAQFALAVFRQEYGRPEGCRFCMMIHDALYAYVRTDDLALWVPRVSEVMENLPIQETFHWSPQLKFLTDHEVGPNLAEMEENVFKGA
jgi:DNA polymerase I-like protein with 3'-5' exonuclease and polymerase domains